MSTKGEVLHHPVNGSAEQTWDGFSWPAFLLGVLWLLVKGLYGHVAINVVLLIATAGFAAPVIWIAYGVMGNGVHKAALIKRGYLTEAQWRAEQAGSGSGDGSVPRSGIDQLARLRQLGELRDNGTLTDEEFQREKARLLEV